MTVSTLLTSGLLLGCLSTSFVVLANSQVPHAAIWQANHVKSMLQFEEAKEGSEGLLLITSRTLVFSSEGVVNELDRNEITAAFVGDERVETGGAAGKTARILIPYGGGAALGVITQKQVGLLTIDYRDNRRGFHSALFRLSKSDAVDAQIQLLATSVQPPVVPAVPVCRPGTPFPSLLIKGIEVGDGTVVPAEFKAMLYEQLLAQVGKFDRQDSVFREGDRTEACTGFTAVVTISGFAKGNAAVRASSGPLGLFVDVTRLKIHVVLTDSSGTRKLDEDMKASRRGDRESLNVAQAVSKEASKKLLKAMKKAYGDVARAS